MKLTILFPVGALLLAGCAAPTVSTSPAISPGASGSASSAAHTGDTITITGQSSGEKMAVTLVHVYQHVAATEFETPDAGKRFASVKVLLHNTGTTAFSDAVDNDVKVTDASGQSYDTWIATGVGCTQFPDQETIAPGAIGLGCVVFQLPQAAKISQVQFALDSGMGGDTAQWQVKR